MSEIETIKIGADEVMVSPEDAELVGRYEWKVQQRANSEKKKVISRITIPARKGKPKRTRVIAMHRMITGAPDGIRVAHIDDDGLNNCRENLRVYKQWTNAPYNWGFSQRQWVSWFRDHGSLVAIGQYDDELDALMACAMKIFQAEGERDPMWIPLAVIRRARAADPDKWETFWPSFKLRPEDKANPGEGDII